MKKLKRFAKVLDVPLVFLLTGRHAAPPKLRVIPGGKGGKVDKPQKPE